MLVLVVIARENFDSGHFNCLIRDLKQTGRQRDDDVYSHNGIPDLVQKK
jgi:hypothetical protein